PRPLDGLDDVPQVEQPTLYPQLTPQRLGEDEIRRHEVREREPDGHEPRSGVTPRRGEPADRGPETEPDSEGGADDPHAAGTFGGGGDVGHVRLRRRDIPAGKPGDDAR